MQTNKVAIVSVGDIYKTTTDFYQIVKITKKQATLQKLVTRTVENGSAQATIWPEADNFADQDMLRRVPKPSNTGMQVIFRINTKQVARDWRGVGLFLNK